MDNNEGKSKGWVKLAKERDGWMQAYIYVTCRAVEVSPQTHIQSSWRTILRWFCDRSTFRHLVPRGSNSFLQHYPLYKT